MSKTITCCVSNDLTNDRRMIRLCNTLVDSGWTVQLVGRVLPDSKPIPQSWKFKTKRFKLPFKRGYFFYAALNIRLYFYLLKDTASVILSVDYDTLSAAARATAGRKKRLVFDAHEWFEEVPELIGRSKVRNKWIKIAKRYLPTTHTRFTVSKGIAEKLNERYHLPFDVIRNFPKLQDPEPSAVRDQNIIVYAGVLNKGRGLRALVMAMHELKAILWLIGEGDLSEQLRELVNREGLIHKVIFHGKVAPEKLDGYLRQARVGINLLSRESASYEYSLANKFFDYVHAGLPQVCMDFPEYRRMNDQYRVASLVGDLKKYTITYAINHLLDDRNYWFTYHVSCLEARKHWQWENEAPRFLQLINESQPD